MWADLVGQLDSMARQDLARAMPTRRYKTGAAICWEGDLGAHLVVIDSGHAAIERTTLDGDRVVVAVVGPGAIIGEQALISDTDERSAGATALSPVQGRALQREAFDELRATHPGLNTLLLGLMERRTREITDLLMESRHMTAEDRVRARLASLAEVFDGTVKVTQATLAALAGTTRPTANAVLGQLSESGAVRLGRGRIEILDASAIR